MIDFGEMLASDGPDDVPGYKDIGWVIFDRLESEGKFSYLSDIEIVSYDAGSSVMWMNEGAGIDYWLATMINLESMQPGRYVMTGISGHYSRGDGWSIDDDEEWYHEDVLPIPSDKEDWP